MNIEKAIEFIKRHTMHEVDCATQAATVADEIAAMGCTCGLGQALAALTADQPCQQPAVLPDGTRPAGEFVKDFREILTDGRYDIMSVIGRKGVKACDIIDHNHTVIGEVIDGLDNTTEPSSKVGGWMSAALEDDKVCGEMKVDIREWLQSLLLVAQAIKKLEDLIK